MSTTHTTFNTPATSSPLLSCPSWCAPEGVHDEFAQHVGGQYAGHHVRIHERELMSYPTSGGNIVLSLVAEDVLSADDQGVTVERTPARVEVYTPAETTVLAVAEADGLAAMMGAAAASARVYADQAPGVEVRTWATPDGPATMTGDDDALRVSLPEGWTAAEREQAAASFAALGQVDPRPVAEGGQVVETWRCQQPDAAEVFLRQVFDIDGEDATILAEEAIRNTYGSTIGTRFTITVDAAEAIRAALAAPGQVENIGQVRNVGQLENIGQHVTTGPQTDAQH